MIINLTNKSVTSMTKEKVKYWARLVGGLQIQLRPKQVGFAGKLVDCWDSTGKCNKRDFQSYFHVSLEKMDEISESTFLRPEWSSNRSREKHGFLVPSVIVASVL